MCIIHVCSEVAMSQDCHACAHRYAKILQQAARSMPKFMKADFFDTEFRKKFLIVPDKILRIMRIAGNGEKLVVFFIEITAVFFAHALQI